MLFSGADRTRVLHLLEVEGGVTEESVRKVAQLTGVPEAEVWGAGTFYGLLREPGPRLRVCTGVSCMLAGAAERVEVLRADGRVVEGTSCLGQCDRAPAVLGEDLELFDAPVEAAVLPDDPELPVNLGAPDREDLPALERARELGVEAVIEAIAASGLQGRGGAGFPAHVKWRAVRAQADATRYVVVNADEGEPGTFKDREVMARRPRLLLEGLAIAAETVGATVGYIYLRGEFRSEKRALEEAIEDTDLGELEVRLALGHGAYICGEETALLESLEGRRGMPRIKPPFPTERGLWGHPTLIHNVETLACVPDIVLRGGERFHGLGRSEPGTKLYCLSGHVARPGVYELPLGVTLDELVEAGGGYRGTPKAFSPGGASSGFLPMSERERPLDFAGLQAAGSMLGSAGVVVLDDSVDMAEAARWQLGFFESESCGQCAPCRIGTRWLREALDRYLDSGDPAHLAPVDDVAWEMEEGSICGLGMVAAWPLTRARLHFPGDFGPRSGGAS